MRSLLMVLAFGAAFIKATTLDGGNLELIVSHRAACLKTSNVDLQLLERARSGDFSDNSDFRKHVYCVARKIGFVDDSGNVNHDVMKIKISGIFKDRTDEMIRACLSNSDDPIQRAVATIKCFYDEGGVDLL